MILLEPMNTQGMLDKRYKFLRTAALLIIALDVFFFFACHVIAESCGKTVWEFTGILQAQKFTVFPVLLKFTIIGFAVISLPLVVHGRSLALAIEKPKEKVMEKLRRIESVESAFGYYMRTHRTLFLVLSFVNLLAAGYFILYGDFLVLVLVSCIGFLNKIIIFPRSGRFNRWLWQALDMLSGQTAT